MTARQFTHYKTVLSSFLYLLKLSVLSAEITLKETKYMSLNLGGNLYKMMQKTSEVLSFDGTKNKLLLWACILISLKVTRLQ